MKQKLFMLSFLAAVAITAVVGKQIFGSNVNESNTWLMQNVEALSQNEVTNGYVLVSNPLKVVTCYKHYVDPNKYIIKEGYDPVENCKYTYKEYFNSYEVYKVMQCEQRLIEAAPAWWDRCSTPKEAKCDVGDSDKRPDPFEYWAP